MSIEALFETSPFDFSEGNRALFRESFRECVAIHYRDNPVFRGFWKQAGRRPEDITDEASLVTLPFLMVHLFKEYELLTGPREAIVLTLTSSGTTGQKSRIFLDAPSLARVKQLAFRIYQAQGMTSETTCNYLCFSYDPAKAQERGTTFTQKLLTELTGTGEVFYALRWDESRRDFFFDERGCREALARFERSERPVRILGFPAYLHRWLTTHEASQCWQLGPESWVLTGGGWKGDGESVSKDAFRALVSERLGIPSENVRDSFGMVEHGVPYVDCRQGRLHVPNYARAVIRSPYTLESLPDGEVGLVQLLCSYVTSYPAVSLLTTDWGRLGSCDCGLEGSTLEILGRAGQRKHEGCALSATRYLSEASDVPLRQVGR